MLCLQINGFFPPGREAERPDRDGLKHQERRTRGWAQVGSQVGIWDEVILVVQARREGDEWLLRLHVGY